MTVGDKIKAERKRIGLTQKQLADMLGLAPNTIAQYELGVSHPRIEQLQRIAEALNTSVTAFIPVSLAEDEAFIEVENERTKLNLLQEELSNNQKQLKDATSLIETTLLRKAIYDCIIPLNREGLLEAYRIISDLSEIKRFKLK